MRPRDILLAVAVTAAWGLNFVMIERGLGTFPPLLFNALRFTLAAVPALFVRPPRTVKWIWIVGVGLSLGVVKFSLLFAGMAAGMPAGLSSLVLQSQAVFTVVFAVLILRERPRLRQLAGLLVAAAGVVLVGLGLTTGAGAFLLVIAAAVAWGLSNVLTRLAAPPDTLRFMVWVSVVASGPLILLSLLVDGASADWSALRSLSWTAAGSVLYVVVVATLAGFGGWGYLLRRYGAATVAPFSMLVPIFGMTAAALFLGESMSVTDALGGVLVVGGILLGLQRGRSPIAPAAQPAGSAPPPAGAGGTPHYAGSHDGRGSGNPLS